jgi:hypothetical protein
MVFFPHFIEANGLCHVEHISQRSAAAQKYMDSVPACPQRTDEMFSSAAAQKDVSD